MTVDGKVISTTNLNSAINGISDTTKFWRGDASWSNELTGTLILSKAAAAQINSNMDVALVTGNRTAQHLEFEIYSYITGSGANGMMICTRTDGAVESQFKFYGAVFNDYAECRTTIDLTPGHVVVD